MTHRVISLVRHIAGCLLTVLLLTGPARLTAAEPSPLTAPLAQTQPRYLDTGAPLEARVADLLAHLTLEEKAGILDHNGPDLERIGLRGDKWNQCLHGVWWDRPTTMFPVSIAQAATWDTGLVRQLATAISDEARAIYNLWHQDPGLTAQHKGLIYRGPVINISRNPYWGRIQECYGEDPFLTGRIGVAYVRGLQGDDPRHLKLAATLKHYAVNNVETDRQKLSATVSDRMLHEYWLPHFRDCVVEGQAQSLMASYNAINGVPNNINATLLTDILKRQWGHQGFVVSDLGGVRTMVEGHHNKQMSYVDAVARSIMAGCDFSDREYRQNIPAAVTQGLLTAERLDDAVTRVLRTRFRLGEFDPQEQVSYSRISPEVICGAPHRQLALTVARQAIVLLQNQNNLLPLDRSRLKTLAVIGPHADRFTIGTYSGKVKDPVKPLAGISDRAGPGIQIVYTAGAEIAPPPAPRAGQPAPAPFDHAGELARAAQLAGQADAAIVLIGTTTAIEREGIDRATLALPGNQEALVKAVLAANPRTVVVLMSCGPLASSWIKEQVPAILQAWWPGEEGGHALADVIFGTVNPAGRLPYTMYESDAQVPPQDEYDISKGFTYMYLRGTPLFAFGHGLSYSAFEYRDINLSSAQGRPGDTLTVSVTVRNTSQRDGDEVVQIYARDGRPNPSPQPHKKLVGFQRVAIAAGQTVTVAIPLALQRLERWDEAAGSLQVAPGRYELHAGAASDDVRLKAEIEVTP